MDDIMKLEKVRLHEICISCSLGLLVLFCIAAAMTGHWSALFQALMFLVFMCLSVTLLGEVQYADFCLKIFRADLDHKRFRLSMAELEVVHQKEMSDFWKSQANQHHQRIMALIKKF